MKNAEIAVVGFILLYLNSLAEVTFDCSFFSIEKLQGQFALCGRRGA
jgi:hypothetical protein